MQPPVAQRAPCRGTVLSGEGITLPKKFIEDAVWISWRARAEETKESAGKTDADLAAEVSEIVGYEVSRQLVNAWFRGRRVPSLPEFMALCAALGADPGEILFSVKVSHRYVTASDAAPLLKIKAPTPDYLVRQAKRLREFRSKKRRARIKIVS